MKDYYRFGLLLIPGAVMRWNPDLQQWCFPLVMEPEEYCARLVLGEWRARAAAHVHMLAPCMLVTGGSQEHPVTHELCSRADQLRRLICEYGAPPARVISIGTQHARHTAGNIENLIAYLKEHPDIKSIGVVVPRFQMERMTRMVELTPYFCEHDIVFEWIEVEDLLVEAGIIFEQEVCELYASDEAKTCLNMEAKGIKALETQTYEPKQ